MEINVKSENQSGGVTAGQIIGAGGAVNEQKSSEGTKEAPFWTRTMAKVREHLTVAILMMVIGAILAYFGIHLHG